MVELPKRPYINIKRACKELDCDIDDLIDCWLDRSVLLKFYYSLSGEKVVFYEDCDLEELPIGDALVKFFYYSKYLNTEYAKARNIKISLANKKLIISFNAYGFFLISPMRSTYSVSKTIKIISQEKVIERSNNGLLTAGFCNIMTPNGLHNLSYDEIDCIDGLEYSIDELFVMRDDINKFHDENTQLSDQYISRLDNSLTKNNRAGLKSHPLKDYVVEIAKNTKNHYLEQGIDLGLNSIATKIKNHEPFIDNGLPSSEQIYKWFKEASIQPSKTTKIFKFDLIFKD